MTTSAAAEIVPLNTDEDVVRARHRVRDLAVFLGMDLVTQTRVITAASELARNTVIYGGGGELHLDIVHGGGGAVGRDGLRLNFIDHGPGIADVEKAMTSGWSSGKGLGLGLPGARQLVNEFELHTSTGTGTRVRVIVWLRRP